MKKILSIILCLVLCLSCFTLSDAQGSDYYVSVGLFYSTTAVSELHLYCADGFLLATGGRHGTTEILEDFSHETDLYVKAGESGILLFNDENILVYPSITTDQVLMSAAADANQRIIEVDGVRYRDGMMFGGYGNGTMAAANYLTLEHYLWGVIDNEMNHNNSKEALKAQAVCARSFAIASLGKHGGGALTFDLCARSHCQVYKGVTAEFEATTNACQETEGQVISYNGKVATAYYHSYNFGYTMNVADVWGTDNGYCRSVKDIYAPDYNWATEYQFTTLQTRLAEHGVNIGTLQSVAVGEHYANGAVKSLIFTGTDRTYTMVGNKIVSWLNLKSPAFSIQNDSMPSVESKSVSGIYASHSTGTQLISGDVCVLDAAGNLVTLDASALMISNGGDPVQAQIEESQVNDFTDEVAYGPVAYLAGKGFGHCVGMNQSGARAMAKQGFTCAEILKFYYSNIEINHISELGY